MTTPEPPTPEPGRGRRGEFFFIAAANATGTLIAGAVGFLAAKVAGAFGPISWTQVLSAIGVVWGAVTLLGLIILFIPNNRHDDRAWQELLADDNRLLDLLNKVNARDAAIIMSTLPAQRQVDLIRRRNERT